MLKDPRHCSANASALDNMVFTFHLFISLLGWDGSSLGHMCFLGGCVGASPCGGFSCEARLWGTSASADAGRAIRSLSLASPERRLSGRGAWN